MNPSSLNLDARQRAMLDEMGVKVWWPVAAPAVDVAAAGEPPPLAGVEEAPHEAPRAAPTPVPVRAPAAAPAAPAPRAHGAAVLVAPPHRLYATEAAAADLTFELDADNLAPSEPVYAGFAVQLTAASTYAATVDITASSTDTIASSLTYSLVETTTFGCDAAAFAAGDPLVTDAATTTSTAADIFTLGAVTTPVFLCFEVTPSATLPQASPEGTVLWEFAAESTTPLP